MGIGFLLKPKLLVLSALAPLPVVLVLLRRFNDGASLCENQEGRRRERRAGSENRHYSGLRTPASSTGTPLSFILSSLEVRQHALRQSRRTLFLHGAQSGRAESAPEHTPIFQLG